ncbi:hypothetical protein L195_g037071 [Trifolium pratense]|uniref:Uncharacterized protein n=1 Tax=Trifolium pratense TaxID=57577 RepID=A0A2K3LR87_TRIPR|nr:hypothetical protein L195_g037071 [Trifolium pratense]
MDGNKKGEKGLAQVAPARPVDKLRLRHEGRPEELQNHARPPELKETEGTGGEGRCPWAVVSDGTLASLPLRLAVRSFSYRRVQSENSPFHIVQGSSVGFHTRVLRTVPSSNLYSMAISNRPAKLSGRGVVLRSERKVIEIDYQ